MTTLTLTPIQWLPLNPASSLITVTFLEVYNASCYHLDVFKKVCGVAIK